MSNKIYPCLWFDGQTKAAADFYCSIFKNSSITAQNPMVVNFEIEGFKVMALNGGPMFKINPSISFFVMYETDEEITHIWNKLVAGGSVMMALDQYPWAKKYGWLVDQFGMTWQLMLDKLPEHGQKIIPSFLFIGDQNGNAQKAINHYTTMIKPSQIYHLELAKAGDPQPKGDLKFGHFMLDTQLFAAMDGIGEHAFKFNEGVSLVIECEDQVEIDHCWNSLTQHGKESQCGWLVDQFGVSWQIIPKNLGSLLMNPEKQGRPMQALMGMKKIEIDALLNA